MKKIIFALMVLALLGNVNAASIGVQQNIPANTVWSFSVTLPAGTDFDDAKVLIDGSRIISFETVGSSQTIQAFDPDNSRLFSSTEPVGNTVYFLVSPMAKGSHDLTLKVDGDDLAEEQVSFFEIYDAEGRADLQSQVNSLRGNVNSVVDQFNSFEGKLGEALTEEDKQALQASINAVESNVSALETELGNLAQETGVKTQVLAEDIEQIKQGDLLEEEQILLGAGLFSIASTADEMKPFIIFILVAIAGAILVIQFRDKLPSSKGLYSSWKKEKPIFSEHDEDIAEQVLIESQDEIKKGKWAIEGASPPEKAERKPFNIGDLLRKN